MHKNLCTLYPIVPEVAADLLKEYEEIAFEICSVLN